MTGPLADVTDAGARVKHTVSDELEKRTLNVTSSNLSCVQVIIITFNIVMADMCLEVLYSPLYACRAFICFGLVLWTCVVDTVVMC